jgi:hypothetical protein
MNQQNIIQPQTPDNSREVASALKYNPLAITAAFIGPLRYWFATYGASQQAIWTEDPNTRQIEIEYANNLHKVPIQERPRILIDRGPVSVTKSGLTEDLATAKTMGETKGLRDRMNFLLYNGSIQMIVEARQQGTCEKIADMACHFLAWSRPLICSSQGLHEAVFPMDISPCQLLPMSEDDEKYQVTVNMPFIQEERWHVGNQAIILKDIQYQLNLVATEISG